MMQQVFLYVGLGLLSRSTSVLCQQLDPIENMCVRFDHQSVIKNDTLYIDGGRQTFIDVEVEDGRDKQVGNITQGYNNFVVAVDLSRSWNWKTNMSQTAITKSPNPRTGTAVPVISRGALYHGGNFDDNIYLWGGTTSPVNTTFTGYDVPLPAQYSLWSFNTTDHVWRQFDTGLTISNRPSSGASAEAADQGLAFYFNGQLDKGSQVQTYFLLGNDAKPFLDGLIVIDMNKRTARNLSTKAVVGNYPRSRARMEYINHFGTNGILVLVGGNQKHISDHTNGYAGDLLPMDEIDIFDVSSYYNSSTPDGTWYKQKVTGDIPSPRIDHCLMLASASDGSSHNLYMYGGRGYDGTDNTFFDDIHILSLPSFTWTRVYQGSSPRYGHTCHRANANMMLTVGGARDFEYTKLPCDWETKGVGVLDMSTITWGSIFDAEATQYHLPARLIATIGGGAVGGSMLSQPVTGFHQEGLARLFNGTSAMPVIQSKKRKLAPFVIGCSIGGAAIICISGLFIYVYRHRLHAFVTGGEWARAGVIGARKEKPELEGPERQELPDVVKYVEPCRKPVELCARDSDLPWRELGIRDSDNPLGDPYKQCREPHCWEPPITAEGVAF